MLNTIAAALLPMVITVMLGFIAGWHRDFDVKRATVLNRMVMLYALPLLLFASVIGLTRDQVLSQGTLATVILVGMAGVYAVTSSFHGMLSGAIRSRPLCAHWRSAAQRCPSSAQ
jgi:malonate transporter